MESLSDTRLCLSFAAKGDVPAILPLIRELAEYEHLSHGVTATKEGLEKRFFGPNSYVKSIPIAP